MTDLINQLRTTASKGISVWGDLQMEAANQIETLTAERDHWQAQHKECTRLLGEAMQERTDVSVERDAYAKAADDMAMSHKVERDALQSAARLALDALEYASTGNRRPEVISPAISALKAVL